MGARSFDTIDHDRFDPAEFRARFVDRGRPVVLRGGMTEWPALQSWSAGARLREALGDKPLSVLHSDGKSFSVLQIPCAEFQRRIAQASEAGELYYIAETPIVLDGDEPGPLGELADDIRIPDYFDRSLHLYSVMFAGNDTRSSCHFHPCQEAILCQVVGRKTVRCFSPAGRHFRDLYPHPWHDVRCNSSRISFPRDGSDPDTTRFPEFQRADAYECILEPGDMLYLPIFWWHVAWGAGVNYSVAHFWRSSWRNRFMTGHGLRSNVFHQRLARPVRNVLARSRRAQRPAPAARG